MRVGVYLRVSTDLQDVSSQNHAIAQWLSARSPESVRTFQDTGASGATDDRPGLLDLLAAIERDEIDTVVTFRLDRISRRAVTAMRLLLDWLQRGVAFYAVDQPILHLGSDNPLRLTVASMLSEIAEIERQTIVSRVRAGLAAAKARGVKLGSDYKLSAPEREQVRVLVSQGHSYRLLAAQFNVAPATIWRVCKEKVK
jgi:DNA invertase Pin-like site-specific DNA recombinase